MQTPPCSHPAVLSHQEPFARSLSPKKLREIVEKHLPAWFKACEDDSDAIVLHEAAFGTSGNELFLFACAIKYATQHGKAVHVTRDRDIKGKFLETNIDKNFAVKVFREAPPINSRAGRSRARTAARPRHQNS